MKRPCAHELKRCAERELASATTDVGEEIKAWSVEGKGAAAERRAARRSSKSCAAHSHHRRREAAPQSSRLHTNCDVSTVQMLSPFCESCTPPTMPIVVMMTTASPMIDPRMRTTMLGRPVCKSNFLTSRWPVWPPSAPIEPNLQAGKVPSRQIRTRCAACPRAGRVIELMR